MAERELGYSEAPSEMFANNAGVIENGQGVQFKAEFVGLHGTSGQLLGNIAAVSSDGAQFSAGIAKESSFGVQFRGEGAVNTTTAKGMQFNYFTEEDMSDFNGAKPVKTVRDNEFKIVLVDGASGESATNKLSILAAADSLTGKFGVLVFGKDGSGNAAELPIGTSGLVVEASDLDIRNLTNADVVTAEQGTSPWVVSASDLDIRDLIYTSDSVTAYQGTSPWVVSASDLDIRDLSHASDSVKIGDGVDFLAINTDGSINVNVTLPGGKVCDYQTSATVGVNSEVLHMYVVTSGKTFAGNSLLVGARGAVKVRFGTSSDGVNLDGVKGVFFQDPKENRDHEIDCLSLLGDGTKAICIGITNLDAASSDVYSTLQGYEN